MTAVFGDLAGVASAGAQGTEFSSLKDPLAVFFLGDCDLHTYTRTSRELRAAGFDDAVVVAPAGLTIETIFSNIPRAVVVRRTTNA